MTTSKSSYLSRKLIRKINKVLKHSSEDCGRLFSFYLQNRNVTNQKELRIIGLRRTGNHTIAEWIKAQVPGKVEHLNNLEVRCNPYRYKYEQITEYYPEHKNWAYKHYLPLSQGLFPQIDCLICGFEDHRLESITNPISEQFHDVYVGKSKERFDLLIMRDPFNLFASRFKSNMIDVKSKRLNAVDLWIQYAKEFLGETHHLNQKKILINYNKWVADIEYRKKISAQMGLEFSDIGIKKVASLGGGSSFDGKSMDGQGNQMAVLDRWKYFKGEKSFREIFQNKTLLGYSREIFGDIPGTDVLMD